MKYICTENFEINDVFVGNKGDVLEVTDAIPKENETLEDVFGYCDIKNICSCIYFFWCFKSINNHLYCTQNSICYHNINLPFCLTIEYEF